MVYLAEAQEAVEPIIELALGSQHREFLPQILAIRGAYECSVKENVQDSFKYLEEATKISEELRDNSSLCLACWRMGLALSMNCEFGKATHYYEKVFIIMEAANSLWGMSLAKSYMSYSLFLGREGQFSVSIWR
jgi:hypothetical protein